MLPDRLCRLLTGFVDGQLSAPEQKQVIELLRRSAEARTLLQHLQADARLLGAMPRVQLPAEFTEQLTARLPKRLLKLAEKPGKSASRFSWRSASIFAAAAALLLALGLAFLHTANPSVGPNRADADGFDVVQDDNELKPSLVVTDSPAPRPDSTPKKAPGTIPTVPFGGSRPEVLVGMPRPDVNPNGIAGAPVEIRKPLREIDLKVPLQMAMREIDRDQRRQDITEELALAPSWRLDFNCQESEVATSRLKRALQDQGIRLLIDPVAADRQKLRFSKTAYPVLIENVSPQECLAILGGLRKVDQDEQKRLRSSNQFIDVKFGRMSPEDSRRLETLFGVKELDPAMKATTKAVPVDIGSREEGRLAMIRAIAIWRGLIPAPGQGSVRNAFLVADWPSRVRKSSNESQLFLNSRQPPKPGTLQIMIVLVPKKG